MLSKYTDMRAFAYSQLDAIITQAAKLKPGAQAQTALQNLNVYK
jgi:hypothetical protein